jgi:Recombinase
MTTDNPTNKFQTASDRGYTDGARWARGTATPENLSRLYARWGNGRYTRTADALGPPGVFLRCIVEDAEGVDRPMVKGYWMDLDKSASDPDLYSSEYWDEFIAAALDVYEGHSRDVTRTIQDPQPTRPTYLPYGYKLNRSDSKAPRLEIDLETAPVVQKIFTWFATGEMTTDEIADRLNAEGIEPPSHLPMWTAAVISSDPANLLGIINDPIYVGEWYWNRTRKVRDHHTGKVRYVECPVSQWLVVNDPALRIVSQEQWDGAHGRQTYRRRNPTPLTDPIFGQELWMLEGLPSNADGSITVPQHLVSVVMYLVRDAAAKAKLLR